MQLTVIERIAERSGIDPYTILDQLKKATPEVAAGLMFDWSIIGRPDQQLPDGDWSVWLILAGRGFGKTRTGAEITNNWAEKKERIALVGETVSDCRDVMVEGPSGILATARPWNIPKYFPSKRKIEWPSGAVAYTYSGDDPEQLRGPEHSKAWCDELGKFKNKDSFSNLEFGMRVGDDPRIMVTTTPRPNKLIRKLYSDETVLKTGGSMYDNALNLPDKFIANVEKEYEGTRLGRQEIYAELLLDVPGALWNLDNIDQYRVRGDAVPKVFKRIIVSIDPPISSQEGSDECGIVALGEGEDGDYYVLGDHSLRLAKPSEWATMALSVYDALEADCIVAEVNQGGDMVESVIKHVDKNAPVKKVWASRGKKLRAEPVAALYEQGRVHHIGSFGKLEDQMTQFTVDFDRRKHGSPDRMDALVHGLTELAKIHKQPLVIH